MACLRLTARQLAMPNPAQATGTTRAMIDNFALGISHGLLLLAAFLLLRRDDLDSESSPTEQVTPAGRRPRA